MEGAEAAGLRREVLALRAQLQKVEAERGALATRLSKLREQLQRERERAAEREAASRQLRAAAERAAAAPQQRPAHEAPDGGEAAAPPAPPPQHPDPAEVVQRLRDGAAPRSLPPIYRDLVRLVKQRQEAEAALAAAHAQEHGAEDPAHDPALPPQLLQLLAALVRLTGDVLAADVRRLLQRYSDLSPAEGAELSRQLLEGAAAQLRSQLPEPYARLVPADVRARPDPDPAFALPFDEASGARLALELLVDAVGLRLSIADITAADACAAESDGSAAEGAGAGGLLGDAGSESSGDSEPPEPQLVEALAAELAARRGGAS
eukprot:TRINITY_DN8562_c2_g2_i2.p2 TRINITY_DN8562_c2_g2~~TRINITY_DN8562_c2_g2_i2.p2  ORF type:complete len:343 (+),score=133.34 TRINITY_DN8562_c2_g2_i2:70-1029(+)